MLIRCAAVLVVGSCGLLFLNSLGPLQWPTVLVYTGLVIVLCGLAGVVRPPKMLGVPRRADAAFAAAGGAMLLAAGLFWPVESLHGAGNARLDAFLPEYDFHEFHELRIHAAPDRVMLAVREVSFADIGVMQTLGRIRNIAMGRVEAGRPASPKPLLALISTGATGFFPLEDNDREFIFGMAGQPWNNSARPVRLTPDSFPSWMPPDNVKIAANLRVDDAGDGWSRLITETRVQATDDSARRTMARYWRIIYPGSGMIRQSLLSAGRLRAEQLN
jgi:hypothetical protein